MTECMICELQLDEERSALGTCVKCNAIGQAYLTKVLPVRFVDGEKGADSIYTTRKPSPIGAALRYIRSRDRLSQKELAGRLGIAHSTLSKWESGDRTPTGDPVVRLKAMLPVIPLEVLI